ncbi:hypothetical protein B0O80DRAFT_99825 [Mortierella sp. GBAus27b]|nr:hypothetical protein B0O80DRAFT_99825 [Mortierella sp. GBAus27b]
MAGHNICNIVQGHLFEQQRPLYLQPVTKDGVYPWMKNQSSSETQREAPIIDEEPSHRRKGVKRVVPPEEEAPTTDKKPSHRKKGGSSEGRHQRRKHQGVASGLACSNILVLDIFVYQHIHWSSLECGMAHFGGTLR